VAAKRISRAVLAVFYGAAGALHLAVPTPFVGIVPPQVPWPQAVVALTGLAEIAGAVGLVQRWSRPLRKAAGVGLAAYALCVWPANFRHMLLDMAKPDGGLSLVYHIPRLALQPVLIWWPLWASDAIRRARKSW
jgi:uncharacterized membrane protein